MDHDVNAPEPFSHDPHRRLGGGTVAQIAHQRQHRFRTTPGKFAGRRRQFASIARENSQTRPLPRQTARHCETQAARTARNQDCLMAERVNNPRANPAGQPCRERHGHNPRHGAPHKTPLRTGGKIGFHSMGNRNWLREGFSGRKLKISRHAEPMRERTPACANHTGDNATDAWRSSAL